MRLFPLIMGLIVSLSALADSLPSFGTTTAGLTRQQELLLGQHWLRQLRSRTSVYEDPLLLDYLHRQIQQFRQVVSLNPYPVTALVVYNPRLNAFAVPGNIIGINTGLFLNVPIEEQFLSVLAHELAHLELHHFSRQKMDQAQNQKRTFLAVLTATLIAPYSKDASQAMFTAALADNSVNTLAYSRQLESEADRRASQILFETGYRPSAVGDMLQTLLTYNLPNQSGAPEYFFTHPLTANRIADSLSFNQDSPVADRLKTPDSLDFHLIRLLLSQSHKVPLGNNTDKEADPLFYWANQIQQVDQLLSTDRWKQALALLEQFPINLQKEVAWRLRQVEYLHRSGQHNASLEQALALYREQPTSIQVTLAAARQLANQSRMAESLQLLRQLVKHYPYQPRLWFYVMQYSTMAGDNWSHFDAEMHYLWLSGQEERVFNTLEAALVSSQWSGIEKSRIKDRLRQWRQELAVIDSL